MSEAAALDVALPVVPLDAAWQERAIAPPARRHAQNIEDPLIPFVAWLMSRHRMGRGRARQVASGLRTLLRTYPIDEVLTSDLAFIGDRLPHVQSRMHVGGGMSAHAKAYRFSAKMLQEWAAVRGMT